MTKPPGRFRGLARLGGVIVLAAPWATAVAQTPDVAVFADLRPTLAKENDRRLVFRWYDIDGRPSVVGFRLILETGNRVTVTQRIKRIDTDADVEALDEYYVENRGYWRLGKQYLPFGAGTILRPSSLAARLDTTLLFEDAPIKIALADGGKGRSRGVVGRIGGVFGLSFAYGDYWGNQATDLTTFQLPKEALGRDHGYQLALGADTTLFWRGVSVVGEYVLLRKGETSDDQDLDLSVLRVTAPILPTNIRLTGEWARDWTNQRDLYRLTGDIPVDRALTWQPFIRFEGTKVKDFGLVSHIKL